MLSSPGPCPSDTVSCRCCPPLHWQYMRYDRWNPTVRPRPRRVRPRRHYARNEMSQSSPLISRKAPAGCVFIVAASRAGTVWDYALRDPTRLCYLSKLWPIPYLSGSKPSSIRK